ncbi:hypothetical protein GBO17_23890 [Mycobacterium avium subsp. hominissuis]|uniref:hypothetical protein n=1 Tax=Mycobacterium avium TaxID=1764 RepID=UPI001CC4F70A|nr:hypothetical protein [Mycobacterium avium]MBZ4558594.1 hypothetical protein [Mycobacterium avium subsp. hominissuis]MBZ4571500.1 hypothetical protein [Mycobacterium avium subsp. hominissuis]MBZ4587798.1 hypothetical protein [Mycobacterium avium subsp. hominissuis]MBZ4627765.1 hypothetical protein [Mycobacterium avium subsp. hominissuis]
MTQNTTEPRGGTYSLEFANPGLLTLKDYPPQLHKVVAVPDAIGKELAHLHLHSLDLQKAAGYLDELDKRGYPPEGDTINDALWNAALITMFKCFGTSRARIKLDPTAIYTEDQLNEFRFWKSMRDKNIAHDDNDAFQAHVFAVLRKWQYVPSIDSVQVIVMEGVTLTEKNAAVLRDLLGTAREWVRGEEKRRQGETDAAMKRMSFEELDALPPVRTTFTNHETVHRTRTTPPK